MSHDADDFDEAFLAELDRALEFASAAWKVHAGRLADKGDAARKLSVFTSIDLLS